MLSGVTKVFATAHLHTSSPLSLWLNRCDHRSLRIDVSTIAMKKKNLWNVGHPIFMMFDFFFPEMFVHAEEHVYSGECI